MIFDKNKLNDYIQDIQSGKNFDERDLLDAAALFTLTVNAPDILTVRDYVADTPLDEMLQEQIVNLQEYITAKKRYQSSMTEENKLKLCNEFGILMNMFEQMFNVLAQGTMCGDERKRLKEFFELQLKNISK